MPSDINRREYLKLGAVTSSTLALANILPFGWLGEESPRSIPTTGSRAEKAELYELGRKTPSICVYCAGGCGVTVTSVNGKAIEVEGDPYHPINEGAGCSKLNAILQLINSERRITKPMKRTNPNKGKDEDPGWTPITWDEALTIIAEKVNEAIDTHLVEHEETLDETTVTNFYRKGKDSPVAWHGSSYWNNEECYLAKKLATLLGSMNYEHQARKCHASTVAALASTFGFGAMTNHVIDAKNSKCFLIVSNPAESHTMEFRWVMRAKDNGAKIIVLDPRYNRTASKADIYGKYRSGGEAAIFLGLIRYLLYEKSE